MKRFAVMFIVAASITLGTQLAAPHQAVYAGAAGGTEDCFVEWRHDVLDCVDLVARPHSRALTPREFNRALRVCLQAAAQGLADCLALP